MMFADALIPATLLRRYKRFLADVELADGSVTTAHIANPGAMTGLQPPGARVWLSRSADPKRKLPLSWELVEVDFGGGDETVGVNTGRTNAIVAAALQTAKIAPLAGYDRIRREVGYGDGAFGKRSRIDFLLTQPGRPSCYLEVKSVTLMRRQGLAEFPDSVTARGARHLEELAAIAASGARAVMLFVIQIGSARALALARDIDPGYGQAFDLARAAGVEMLAYTCRVTPAGIELAQPVPILP